MIALAGTDEEIAECYDVMSQLRPHIKREDFVARVRRQRRRSTIVSHFCEMRAR
jgi:hypothetical protein